MRHRPTGSIQNQNTSQNSCQKIKAKFGTDFKDIYDATAFLDEEYISSIILCDNVLFQSPKLEIKTLKKALVFYASGPTPPFGKQPYESQLPCPSLTLRGHGLLYSKSSTNVFQLLDSKLYKVCANQLSKQQLSLLFPQVDNYGQ